MAVPGAGEGESGGSDLRVSSTDLTKLADDLDDMQSHLTKQVKDMDAIVDRIEGGWHGPAATAYREVHRGVAEDAVRIREVMKLLEQAVRMSRDGFTADEIDVLTKMRGVQVDINSEADGLSTPNTAAGAGSVPAPRSSFHSF
ncbi:WXG100 family type VII secretion target [Streptomyces sp. NPDC019396]|uniref:WXG100 family type VII secretion target n=1 Tax=Streptomyces sp. NPDC019396 TaxID=3154687 RepID=UPI0033E7C789